jgi:hypothetical protein
MLMLRHGKTSFLPSLGQSHMRMKRCIYLQPLNRCPTARCQGNHVMPISMHMSSCCPMPSIRLSNNGRQSMMAWCRMTLNRCCIQGR